MFAPFLSQVIADGESSLTTADDNRIDFVQHGRLLDSEVQLGRSPGRRAGALARSLTLAVTRSASMVWVPSNLGDIFSVLPHLRLSRQRSFVLLLVHSLFTYPHLQAPRPRARTHRPGRQPRPRHP